MNIDQTSTKNEAKNFPKMDENQAKKAPRDALVGSWPPRGPNTPPRRPKTFPRRPFGGVLGAWGPGGCLGRKKVPKMALRWRPKRKQNPSWGILEASWEPRGGVM